jgi:hypothetical protein
LVRVRVRMRIALAKKGRISYAFAKTISYYYEKKDHQMTRQDKTRKRREEKRRQEIKKARQGRTRQDKTRPFPPSIFPIYSAAIRKIIIQLETAYIIMHQ